MPTNPDDSAFPHEQQLAETGLTKRECIATFVLARVATARLRVAEPPDDAIAIDDAIASAEAAVAWADHLIAALNKNAPKE